MNLPLLTRFQRGLIGSMPNAGIRATLLRLIQAVHNQTHRVEILSGGPVAPVKAKKDSAFTNGANANVEVERDVAGVIGNDFVFEVHNPKSAGATLTIEVNAVGKQIDVYPAGDAPVAAAGTITVGASAVTNNARFTVGYKSYRMRTVAGGGLVQANDVLIGASAAATAANINDAINADATAIADGRVHSATSVNPDIGSTVAAAVVTCTAKVAGTGGDSLPFLEVDADAQITMAGGTNVLDGGAAVSFTTTGAQLRTAVHADVPAFALVTLTNKGNGSAAIEAGEVVLEGGVDGTARPSGWMIANANNFWISNGASTTATSNFVEYDKAT